MFLKLKRGPHLLQSCFCEVRNNFPPIFRIMHPSFESLVVINTPTLQASLMDILHNTCFRSILEDDSISSASKTRICSCLGKEARLWLIARPSIRSFCIAHSTFTSTLCFHLGFIQPSAFCRNPTLRKV